MIEQVSMTEVLLDAAKEVFQTMVFMDIERLPEPGPDVHSDALLSSITFKGDLQGCLGIFFDLSCARNIAGNMLGLQSGDQIPEQDLADAIGEVTNMVMGSVKARMHEVAPTMELSIPTVVCGREMKNSPGDGATQTIVDVRIDGQYNAKFCFLSRAKK